MFKRDGYAEIILQFGSCLCLLQVRNYTDDSVNLTFLVSFLFIIIVGPLVTLKKSFKT